MRKSLRDLQLSIPTIDILESRKIVGGYAGNGPDNFWQGSLDGEDNFYGMPEVVLTTSDEPDSGIDPHENENGQDDDQYREIDNDQNRGDNNNDTDHNIVYPYFRTTFSLI